MSDTNMGYDHAVISALKTEIEATGRSFIRVEDPELNEPMGEEYAHFQFIGTDNGKEVVYDAVMYTLRLHHSSLVYEEAERRANKEFPLYVPLDQRDETHQQNEEMDDEVELLITEFIEEIEENEEVKVTEHIDTADDAEFGIELDICLNTEVIDDDAIDTFVARFNSNKLVLDPTLYSFKSLEDDE